MPSVAAYLDDAEIGDEIYALAGEIYPICRSITGQGVRETLRVLAQHIELTVHEVPTGTQVFDWTIPKEWNIRDAYIKSASGKRVVDFRDCNLHVVGYSIPLRATLPLSELRKHIFTLPEQPDAIPYRTSYYAEQWGFCMAHRRLAELEDGIYEVVIDAALENGSLSYGEHFHQGETDEEFLLSAHICHPSMANDNCSGVALLTHLAKRLARLRTRFSYRILFAPGTIGAIAWLARNETAVPRIKHGLVLSCVGDSGGPTYKRSRRGDAMIDRVMAHVLSHTLAPRILDFFPYGYDERQYCSPGFDVPVGLFQRSQFGTFPQYHTSGDNLAFIAPNYLAASYRMIADAIEIVECDRRLTNMLPKCEPQLGRRGLYDAETGRHGEPSRMAMLWVLNLSDGRYSLFDIAERARIPFRAVRDAAEHLEQHGLLQAAVSGASSSPA